MPPSTKGDCGSPYGYPPFRKRSSGAIQSPRARKARGGLIAKGITLGSMTEKKKKSRPAPISYRPPVGKREEVIARAQREGLSVSAYLTKCVFNKLPPRQTRRPPLEKKLVAKLLGEAARIRDALHEISLHGDCQENALLVEQAVEQLIEIRTLLMKAMGRKP